MVMLVACAKFIDVHTTIMEEDHSHQCLKNFEKKTSKKTSLLHFQCPYYKETDWVPTSSANLQSYQPKFDAGLNQKTEQSTCSNLVSHSREQICTFEISTQNDFSSVV